MTKNRNNTILAIDTASEYLSIAIQNNLITDSILLKVGNTQSTFVLPKIHELLAKHNLTIGDVTLIAYNQGPGSFTGLRIGISVAIGIAYGLGINLVAIPSFAIYANAIIQQINANKINLSSSLNINDKISDDHLLQEKSQKILVGIDARLGQIYLAGLNSHDFSYFLEPTLANPEQITAIENCILCGNGFTVYQEQLSPKIKAMPYINHHDEHPNAINLIELSDYYPKQTPEQANLLYVRNKIALNLEEQNANK